MIKHDGVVYHFYCAVNNAEQRGIAIATSKPMGRSAVRFPKPETKNRRMITELNEGWKTWLIDNSQLTIDNDTLRNKNAEKAIINPRLLIVKYLIIGMTITVIAN